MNNHKKRITAIGDELSVIKWNSYMTVTICMIGGHGKQSHWWAWDTHNKYSSQRVGGDQGPWRACIFYVADIGKDKHNKNRIE